MTLTTTLDLAMGCVQSQSQKEGLGDTTSASNGVKKQVIF